MDDESNLDSIISTIEQQIAEAPIEDAPLLIAHYQDELKPPKGSKLELFLRSHQHQFEAVRLIAQEGNFDEAASQGEAAASGFQQLGLETPEVVSRALAAFATAITEMRNYNINRGQMLFADIEKYLKNAGQYGNKFQAMIDNIRPEALFASAVQAVLKADVDVARELITRASNLLRRNAEIYATKDSPQYFHYLGIARFYSSVILLHQSLQSLFTFDFEKLMEQDVSGPAKEAAQLLSRADLTNAQVGSVYYQAQALGNLLEVMKGIASQMRLCFEATFKPDAPTFLKLRTLTREAKEHVAHAGPAAASYNKICDNLLAQIQNLERLARPNKTDFGIFSGLVSASLFIPLFVITSWARNAYSLNVDPSQLFLTDAGLALIGGFGAGALKFKNFLFSGQLATSGKKGSTAS